MYTIVRSYFGKGAKELFDAAEKNKVDVEKLMRSVKGLVSYTLVRSEDGGFSVTVCNDKAGCDETVEKARDWIAKNAAGTGVAAPKVSEGNFDRKATLRSQARDVRNHQRCPVCPTHSQRFLKLRAGGVAP